MHKLCGFLMAGISALTVFSANADQVIFKTGDKLTGTVKSVEGGKMTFDSAVAGTVTLKMDDIATFTTEKPIDLMVKKGETEQKVSVTAFGSEAGKIAAADGTVYTFADIAKINPPPVKWTGNVSAGATIARGNTHSETATAMFDASRRTDIDRTSVYGGYYFARERDKTTHRDDTSADNWFLKGQYDYFLSKKSYLYGSLKYEKDRIAHLDKRFTPGTERVIVEWQGVRILLEVCYDLRFPIWARNCGDYDMILYVASWPTPRVEAWSALLVARAIENQCFVAGVNRVGTDPTCEYCGGSILIDPYGKPLATCPRGQECEATADIDMPTLEAFREKFPVLRDADIEYPIYKL